MTIIIFANGELQKGTWLQPYIDEADLIIAADGGIKHLQELGVKPDIVIGDLDSADSGAIKIFQRAGVKIVSFNPDKDETDLELALHHAYGLCGNAINVFGAIGKRLDHSFANLLLLAHPKFTGSRISYIEPGQRVWLIHHKSPIYGSKGDIVSLLPIGGDVHVVKTTGLRWPLQDEILQLGPTRGVSNELSANKAVIELGSGKIICIHSRYEAL